MIRKKLKIRIPEVFREIKINTLHLDEKVIDHEM